MSDQERLPGNSTFHDPVPYKIRLRVILKDDMPPETREVTVVAYSLMEAMMQAGMEAIGSYVIDPQKLVIEHCGPDESAYWKIQMERLAYIVYGRLKGK